MGAGSQECPLPCNFLEELTQRSGTTLHMTVGCRSRWLLPYAMFLTVSASLLSGKTVTLQAEPGDSVKSLKKRAQTALEVGGGRLLEPSGSVLNDAATIKKKPGFKMEMC